MVFDFHRIIDAVEELRCRKFNLKEVSLNRSQIVSDGRNANTLEPTLRLSLMFVLPHLLRYAANNSILGSWLHWIVFPSNFKKYGAAVVNNSLGRGMVSSLGKRRMVGWSSNGCATVGGARGADVGASTATSAQPSSFAGVSPVGVKIVSKS